MLARANRITSASDYKNVVRRGWRGAAPHLVTYMRKRAGQDGVRFGFIVAKNVGGAVQRNRVRRRLKAASFELITLVGAGNDVVVRALPSAAEAEWPALRAELSACLAHGSSR